MNEKLAYETPEVEILGTIEDLTDGNASGSNIDADFSAGTAVSDLTFS